MRHLPSDSLFPMGYSVPGLRSDSFSGCVLAMASIGPATVYKAKTARRRRMGSSSAARHMHSGRSTVHVEEVKSLMEDDV